MSKIFRKDYRHQAIMHWMKGRLMKQNREKYRFWGWMMYIGEFYFSNAIWQDEAKSGFIKDVMKLKCLKCGCASAYKNGHMKGYQRYQRYKCTNCWHQCAKTTSGAKPKK